MAAGNLQTNGHHTDLNINNLLSIMYPGTPFSNMRGRPQPEVQKLNDYSPRKSLDPLPQQALAASYTSLYVKNCPPEADDLWVYER